MALATEWLDGFEVSSPWTSLVTSSDDGTPVVVDTSAAAGHVVAHYLVGDSVRSVADLGRPGLVFPLAWSADRGVAVFGRVCPEPMLEDPSMLDAPTAGGCGIDVHQFSLRRFEPETATWSEIELDVPLLSGQELAVLGANGSAVLLRGGDRADEDVPALFGLDLVTGRVSDLGAEPQDVAPNWCGSDGVFLSTTLPDLTNPEDAQSTSAVVVNSDQILTTSLEFGPLLPIGCSGDSILAIEPSGSALVRITPTSDGVESTPVSLPSRLEVPSNRRIDVGRRQPNQPPLLWGTEAGSFQLWEFHRETWSKVGAARPGSDPVMLASVVDGHALAFAASDSVTTLTEI